MQVDGRVVLRGHANLLRGLVRYSAGLEILHMLAAGLDGHGALVCCRAWCVDACMGIGVKKTVIVLAPYGHVGPIQV